MYEFEKMFLLVLLLSFLTGLSSLLIVWLVIFKFCMKLLAIAYLTEHDESL